MQIKTMMTYEYIPTAIILHKSILNFLEKLKLYLLYGPAKREVKNIFTENVEYEWSK